MKVSDSLIPLPRIIKGYPLCAADKSVVEPFGIEGRIQVNQVNRLPREVFPHYLQAVPKVEAVWLAHVVPPQVLG